MAVGKNICSTSSTFDAYDQTLQLGRYLHDRHCGTNINCCIEGMENQMLVLELLVVMSHGAMRNEKETDNYNL